MDADIPETAGHSMSNSVPWRQRAVRLAVQADLDGQAQVAKRVNPEWTIYRCVSVSEPTDHYIQFDHLAGTVQCDCPAGVREHPCKHAGAVLLLIANLVPERVRDPEGHSNAR